MKKIICMLLLALSGSMIAQTKTLVTPYGEKVTIIPGAGTADNGLTATNGKIQLGGALVQPTTITTSATNTLEINNTTPGAIKIVDGNQAEGKILVSNANGVATWETNTGGQQSLYASYASTTASSYKLPPNVVSGIPGVGSYTAGVTGKYQVIFHSFFSNLTGTYGVKQFYFNVVKGGTTISSDETYGYVGDYFNTHLSRVVSLTAGDVIGFGINTASDGFWIGSTLAYRNIVEIIYLGS